jgi:hypothetical protein
MLIHAHIGNHFTNMAYRYGWMVSNTLPVRNVRYSLPDGSFQPCAPYTLYLGQKPNTGRFRVLFCPCVVKIYKRRDSSSNAVIQTRNLLQRGVRGIFAASLPTKLAGKFLSLPRFTLSLPRGCRLR